MSVAAAATTTTTTGTSTSYSDSAVEPATFSATVSSAAGTVDEGTVTFTILNAGNSVVGQVSASVVKGVASGNDDLVAGTVGGTYTIQAVYTDPADFVTSTGTNVLSVTAAATTTTTTGTSTSYSVSAGEPVTLSATVSSAAGTVDEGTVTFTILNAGNSVVGLVSASVVNGVASSNDDLVAGTAAGTYTIQAVYTDPFDFVTSTGTNVLSVTAAATTTTTTATSTSYSDSAVEPVALSATVTSAAGMVDEGTVAFTILSGGNPVGSSVSASVVNGVASTNDDLVAGTAGGTYTIQAVYTDPVDFVTSTGTNVLTVTAAATATTTTGTSTSYSVSAGEPVTLSASVRSAAGTVDEGTVTFTILNAGNSVVGSVSASVVNGVASTLDDLVAGTAGGTYTIQAVYTDPADFVTSTGTNVLSVTAAATTTTTNGTSTSYSDSAVEPVALSATVSSAAGTVDEGTVTFTILNAGNSVVGSVSASVVNGVASTIDNLVAGTVCGTYTIQAVYTDPVDFVTSTGTNVLSVTAAATTTTTTGTSTSYSESTGEPVTLSASVSSAAGTVDEGTVAFTVLSAGNSVVGSVSASVVNGVASTIDDLVAGTAGGTYTIQAVYTDPVDFVTSTGTNVLSVTGAATTTTTTVATTSYNDSTGEPLELSATVSSAAGAIDEGTVTFTILSGGNPVVGLVSASVVNGVASINDALVAGTAGGTYTIQAVYTDPVDFVTSTGTNVLSVTAAATATTTAGTSTPYNDSAGEPVTLSATVTSAVGTVNEGTVTFTILNAGNSLVGSASAGVVNGVASTIDDLVAGTAGGAYTIQAVYTDPVDFVTSTGTNVLSVTAAATTTTTSGTSTSYNDSAGEPVSLSATVSSAAGMVDEGTVTFIILSAGDSVVSSISASVVNGVASTIDNLVAGTAAGTYTIQAVYTDPVNFVTSTGTNILSVTGAATTTTTTGTSTSYSDSASEPVTLSATVTSAVGTVDEGTATFTILSAGNSVVGQVSASVVNGVASTIDDLLAGTAAGTYTIQAVYTDPIDFATSTGTNDLSVTAAATTTVTTATSTSYNDSAGEPVSLSATVSSAAGTINQGSVTFTILNSSGIEIGSTFNAQVTNGVASANVLLAPGTAVGVDTIQAVYGGTSSLAPSLPSDASLIVSAGTTTTTAADVSTDFREPGQTITLDADVISGGFAVDEGTVTFTVLNGPTPVGSPTTTNVSAGIATTPYTLPPDTLTGTYTIQAVYDDSGTGDFLDSTDTSHSLTITQPPAYQLVIATEPPSSPATVTAGQLFNPQPVVYVEDKYGELETGDNSTVVTATFGDGSGTFTTTVVGGIATFTNVLDNTAGTTTLEFTSGNLVATTSNEIVVVPAAASQLVVTQQPSTSATAAQSFQTQPVVAEEDPFGNVITTDNTSTVTAVVGNVGTASLQGTELMVPLINGVATFAGLSYNKAELMNISFSTDASGVSSVTSNDVLVIPSPATQLIIAQEPSKTAIAGSPFQTEPVVYEEDKYGNIETSDNSTVVSAMQFTGKGPLAGALNATVSGGVATFATLADTRAETTMLQFVSGTLFSSPTTQIVVSPATASSLIVVTQPSPNDTAGQAFPVQPVVEEVDQYGNLETGDNSSQVSVASSGAGTLLNSSPVTVSGGIATFSGLQDNTAEDPTLTFSVGNLAPAVSSLFTVVAGAPYKLAITRKPAGVVQAGNAIPFVVDAQDMYGNTATSFSGQVTAVLASGPGSLGGTTVMTAVNGEADFTDLYSTATGSITLGASGTASDGTSLTAPATTSIPVGPGKAAQLVFYQEPWPNATAGQAFRTQPAVYEEDAYGNIETADSQTVVTVSSTGVGKLQGGSTTATVLDGIATFSGLLDDTAETIALDFTSPGLTAAVSTNVVVSPAALDHIMIHTPPSPTATAGQAFGTQPVIWELDQYGNIETGDNSSQVTAALASGTGPLQGTTTVTVQGGIATFTNLADDLAETITLSFSVLDTSITAGPSSSIVVSVGAASRLLIRVQPPSSATAGEVFGTSVVISEVDANGNVETSDNSTVISAAPSGGPAVLEGTQATVQAGVATFTGLVDDTAGTSRAAVHRQRTDFAAHPIRFLSVRLASIN